MSLLDNESLWSKLYNGSCYDFIIHEAYQELIPVDRAKYEMISFSSESNFMTVPTNNMIVVHELINNLFRKSVSSLLYGAQFAGKSSLLRMFKNTINLDSKRSVNFWTYTLKKTSTQVRRDGKNFLISPEETAIVIEDLDLGHKSHIESMRQMIEEKMMRDDRFEEYQFEEMRILGSTRKVRQNHKILDNLAIVNILPLSRQNLETIFTDLFHRQIKTQGMNK